MTRSAGEKKRRIRKSPEDAFGHVLRAVRQNLSLSQEALADEGGYHRTYISLLERGEKSPSLRTIFNLAQALQTTPTDLIRRTERVLSRQ